VRVALASADQGVVDAVETRSSLLYRSDAFRQKIIAANVSQVVLVLAAMPSWYEDLLNRCLVAVECAGVGAIIVFNKVDLPEAAAARERLALYESLGYPVVPLSARLGVDALQPRLLGHISVLVGQSGMGKSTIVNALAQRRVAIVADAPGTTRDHVGVTLNLAGLVVRYVDAPGIRDTMDPIEAQAIRAATKVAQSADLLLLITDSEPASVAATERIRSQFPGRQILTVQTRADSQGRNLAADITLANMHKDPSPGAAILADAIAARLVPADYLASNEPWAFTTPSSLLL